MDYQSLLQKIEIYKNNYNIRVIGRSHFNRNIFAVEKFLSKDFFTAIFVCSVHAREHITTDLVCKMIDDGLFDGITNFNLSFVLMANPDGVELCKNGINSAPKKHHELLLKTNNNSFDFSLWKANGKGVDINNNFDANWGTNVHSYAPSSSGFIGEFPESEPETHAVANYIRSQKTFLTISYHSKGEEIYYNFFQDQFRLKRDKQIAEQFAKSTGYKIKNVENVSSGGLKDYCVQKLKIPSLTIEIGSDNLSHPIDSKFLQEIFECHKFVANDLIFAYNVFEESRLCHIKKNL